MSRVLNKEAQRRSPIVDRVLQVVRAAAKDWRRAPQTLEQAQRDLRQLHSVERRFVGEAIFGLIRWRRRLQASVGASDDRVAYDYWLDNLAGDAPTPAPELSLGERWSFPDWIVSEVERSVGAGNVEAALAAMNRRAPLIARANRLQGTRDALAIALAAEGIEALPVALAPDALELQSQHNVYGLNVFKKGAFELQDTGSQLICELVAPPPGGVIVDACAGAGGKSLALAAQLQNRGRIYALDVAEDKLQETRKRARRAGVTSVQAQRVDGQEPLRDLQKHLGKADRVLVDAPCTGLGVLRRHPEARWRIQPHEVEALATEQLRLLSLYAQLTRPGGRVIYATCSLSRRENDDVVDRFLAQSDGAYVEVTAADILSRARAEQIGDGRRLRVMPHSHNTDGFFAAVLRRTR